MNRSTLWIFGLVAVFCVIVLPALAFSQEGGEEAAPQHVSADLEDGKELFVTNCGSCHALYKAGTDGVVGPDLDERLAPPSPTPPDPAALTPRVLDAVVNGRSGGDGQMPAGILTGPQAEEVASFVARCAGVRGDCQPAAAE